jgi:hypothetical protein
MPLAALATENATPFFGQDTPAPVYFNGTALCLPLTNAELGVRFHAGLSVYPEKSVAVHKFTVQATNTLAFTNLIFGDMGAGPDSVRHYNYADNVPCLVTNGITYTSQTRGRTPMTYHDGFICSGLSARQILPQTFMCFIGT